MSFPKLSFPLQVDFGMTCYWIGDCGPFSYGEAVTAFFNSKPLADNIGDELWLMRKLEVYLQLFGMHLQPYAHCGHYESTAGLLRHADMERPVDCTIHYSLRPVEGVNAVLVEQYTFQNIWSFLYIELCRAIQIGNAPRECRLCGGWFLHKQGEKFLYCERVAPGESEKTCREVGARTNFEHKLQSDEVWKLYKRAYKKYYARVMKGNMTREEFNNWVEHAAAQRDFSIELMRVVASAEARARVLEDLKENLNQA